MPTKADLGAIFDKWGLDFPKQDMTAEVQGMVEKPYDVVRQLAKNQGLKAITERLRYGRKLSQRKSTKLGWQHFIEAHLMIASSAEENKGWN
jgi:hypothetical protein